MLLKEKRIPIKEILFVGLLPSFIKKLFYRIKGYKIEKGVKIGFGSIIIGRNIHIKKNASIGYFSIIKSTNLKLGQFTIIGSFCYIDTEKMEIGDDSKIREQVYVGGMKTSDSYLKVGSRCTIMQGTYINPTKQITIGDDTGIGGRCLLFTHGSWLSVLDGYTASFSPIIIGNNVWIPWNVTILPNSNIGDHVIIGSNSLVNTKIPSKTVAIGNPAKVIIKNFPDKISDNEQVQQIELILNDFVSFLQFKGFDTIKVKENDLTLIKVKRKQIMSELVFLKEAQNYKFSVKDRVSLIFGESSSYVEEISSKMYHLSLFLKDKSRIGHSEIGEEFVKFLSRYGIRFTRIENYK